MRRLRESTVPLALALITVLLAGSVLLICRHVVGLEAQHDVDLLAADSASEVSAEIGTQLGRAALVAAGSGSAVPSSAAASTPAASTEARALARDSGVPVLDDGAGGLVVVARYKGTPAPTNAQERRERFAGLVVVPLDLDSLLFDLGQSDFAVVVDGPRERVAASPGVSSGSGVSSTAFFTPSSAAAWSVTASGPPGRPPAVAWLLAVTIVLSGAGAASAAAIRQSSSRARSAELLALQQTNATVARLAILAQQTRDLGELLPSMTTELAATLGLRGLSITTATPVGDRPLFGWGVQPVDGTSALGAERVAAGETSWLRLSRGGRTAARLWAVAGRDLDRHDVNTLVAVADLVASALTNAEAFAEQRLTVERMKAVDDLKSVFLATASHELRTPVVAIAGYSGVLNENWDQMSSEQAHGLVQRVDRNARRLSQMVEDLLDFSRLERSNGPTEEQSRLDLAEVVGQVLRDQGDLARHHTLTSDLARGLVVRGSHQALERVVSNLVGNATKYTPSGTRIRVLVRGRGDAAEVVVEDDGPGVPEADRERVFSRFYRGQGDEVTRTRGTGLGLAIVSEFAATMGGEVRLEESGSGGARFVVTFPLESSPVAGPGVRAPSPEVPGDPL